MKNILIFILIISNYISKCVGQELMFLYETTITDDGKLYLNENQLYTKETTDSANCYVQHLEYLGEGIVNVLFDDVIDCTQSEKYFFSDHFDVRIDTISKLLLHNYIDMIELQGIDTSYYIYKIEKFSDGIIVLAKDPHTHSLYLYLITKTGDLNRNLIQKNIEFKAKSYFFIYDWDGDGKEEIFVLTATIGMGNTVVILDIFKY